MRAINGVDDEDEQSDDQDNAQDANLRFGAASIRNEFSRRAIRVHIDALDVRDETAAFVLLRHGPARAVEAKANQPSPERLRAAQQAYGGDKEEEASAGPRPTSIQVSALTVAS